MTTTFLRSVSTMMKGTAIAQAIPVLISPLLTRIYTPEDYGLFVLFVAVASVLAVIATLRYELAIVVATTEEEAVQIARFALALLCVSCLVIAVTAGIFAEQLANIAGRPGQVGWIHALAPMVAALGAYQVASYLATRARRFDRLAKAAVIQQTVFAVAALGLGAAFRVPAALIAGRIGAVASGLWILRPRGLGGAGGGRFFGAVAFRHRQFALYNCPYSLIGTLGRELFLLALMAASQIGAAGLFGLARSVVYAPVTLLSAALSQVFYREAASTLHTPRFEEIVLTLTRAIARLAAPAFAALPLLAPDAFALLFGDRWRDAGDYAALLAPVGFLFLFSSWPERVFEVAGRQQLSFFIQLGFDSMTAVVLITMVRSGAEPLLMLSALVAIGCAYHLSYLSAAVRVARLSLAPFRSIVAEATLLAVVSAIGVWLALSLLADVRLVLAVFAAGLLVYYVWLFPRVKRDLAALGDTP
jgi:O-antigen/teichoic acid export membrane protein